MKAVIIGSSQYRDKFEVLRNRLVSEGNEVRIPAFDDHPELDDFEVCEFNRAAIEWADVVYLIWDRRSTGTIFDFGMVFMSRKRFIIEYLEEKTLRRTLIFNYCFAKVSVLYFKKSIGLIILLY